MYCTKCGQQNPDGATFCSKCGKQIAGVPQRPPDPNAQYVRPVPVTTLKPKSGCLVAFFAILGAGILIFVAIAVVMYFAASNTPETAMPEATAAVQDIECVFNVRHFSRISEARLIGIMGEPDEIKVWRYTGNIPLTSYHYRIGSADYDFAFRDGALVRLMIWEQYYDSNGDTELDIPLSDNALPMLGIEVDSELVAASITASARRWDDVNMFVDEVLLTGSNNVASTIKVTYDKEAMLTPDNPLEIVSVNLSRDSIGTPELTVIVVNNGDVSVEAYDFIVFAYDAYGKRLREYGVGDDYYGGTSQDYIVKSGSESGKGRYWPLYEFDNAKKVDVAIERVLLEDGTLIMIPEDYWIWVEGEMPSK